MWILELSQREKTDAFNEFSIEERKQLLESMIKEEKTAFLEQKFMCGEHAE